MLQMVEKQNIELQNVESYKRSKNKRSKITKRRKTKCWKLQEVLTHEYFSYKVRHLLAATVQYTNNPQGFFL
jgi:hypothetical protein